MSRKHTFPVNIFNLEGGETKLAHDKGNFQALVKNWTRTGSVVGTSDIVFGGLRVQFSPWVRNFSLSRVSMVSPPSKLKMFTGSVCVLLTSVIKIDKNKTKIYLRNHEFMRKKQNGGWKTDFIFLFMIRVVLFLWSEFIRVQFSFIFIFLFDPSWSKLVRVDPSWSVLDWQSELIQSDFCTCLFRCPCSLHDFWNFLQHEDFRCMGHAATRSIDRGNCRLAVVFSPVICWILTC